MADEVAVPGRDDQPGSPGELRASHEDRDRVVEVLQAAAGDGRLTTEEFDERLGTALTARTHGELARLTADLAAVPGAGIGPAPEPKDVIRIECGSSSTTRDGAWIVPRRIEVRVKSGHVKLDFTQAVISQPTLQIDAEVTSGRLMLVTRPGIMVDTDDVAIRSGTVRIRPPGPPEVPVTLRIDVSGKVGSGTISARPPRPPRRTLWQWLLRRPTRPALTS